MSWEMWAYRCEGFAGFFYSYVTTHKRLLDLVGLDEPKVQVFVQEDPEGQYYGWVSQGSNVPVMVQPNYAMYSMQFPYGPDAEEKRDKGHTVRLRIDEI